MFKNQNADAQSKYSEGHKESLKVKTNSQIQNSQSFRDSFPMKIRKNRNLRQTGNQEKQKIREMMRRHGWNSTYMVTTVFWKKIMCLYISNTAV